MTKDKMTSVGGALLVVTALLCALFLTLDYPAVPAAFVLGQGNQTVMETTVIVTPLDTGTSDASDDTGSCFDDYTSGNDFGTNVQDAG